jgi:hypothetical protein
VPIDELGVRAPVVLSIETRGSHVRVGDLPGGFLLDATGQEILSDFCSALLPAAGEMPAAGDLQIARYVEAVCVRSSALSGLLRRVVNALLQSSVRIEDAAEKYAEDDPSGFEILKSLIYEGYYSHPTVLARLEQETGWRASAAMTGSPMAAFDDALLKRVSGLPSSYRKEP